ncbi:hypothetical protein TsFJ059_000308 [Trichoderma semiorbis]|uniref:Uncharacterized protein n=1 Tax=Trichoderma semiorbis TaxID=1491008 RepID=A0A9P8HWZ1_9HYPO|nr:hypothetical protein TsFJ059_000308 [Trichoderma semiorbis]
MLVTQHSHSFACALIERGTTVQHSNRWSDYPPFSSGFCSSTGIPYCGRENRYIGLCGLVKRRLGDPLWIPLAAQAWLEPCYSRSR